jgi:hypothetical protein
MSSFFEDLNDLITENPLGQVLAITVLILLLSTAIAAGIVVLILKLIYRHIA